MGIDLEHILDGDEDRKTAGAPAPKHDGKDGNVLTAEQLTRLEQAFAAWVAKARGKRSAVSRNRARLVFLLLRYTGAKLGEILSLNDEADFALAYRKLILGGRGEDGKPRREIYLPSELYSELKQVVRDPGYAAFRGAMFKLDQGYVRRVLYERAAACGLPKHLANPNTLRRSRAVELLQNGVPLTVVQRILGHLTANSTAAFLDLPEKEQKRLEKYFLERENRRATGLRNTFFGKVTAVDVGDIQSRVEVVTLGGHVLVSVISNQSLEAMGLKEGEFVTARIKAPWVVLNTDEASPAKSGANRFRGVVEKIVKGKDTAEVVLSLEDGTALCALLTLESLNALGVEAGDGVWAITNAFSVILSRD